MTEQLTTTEGITRAILPYYTDGGKKASYLSYVVAGFSVTEATKLADVHLKSVHRWREDDPAFSVLEEQARTSLRRQLADEILDIEFTRNMRLFLAKDFRVLYKDAIGQVLTEGEDEYLKLIRKFYTPQQFAMVKQMVGGNGKSEEGFNFTRDVLTIRLEKQHMEG